MHADLSDASVHVPVEIHPAPLTPVTSRRKPSEDSADSTSGPTYDEIANRALEMCQRRGSTTGRDLQDWVDAERQLRTERQRRSA